MLIVLFDIPSYFSLVSSGLLFHGIDENAVIFARNFTRYSQSILYNISMRDTVRHSRHIFPSLLRKKQSEIRLSKSLFVRFVIFQMTMMNNIESCTTNFISLQLKNMHVLEQCVLLSLLVLSYITHFSTKI